MGVYEEAYERLNAEQKDAVDSIEGPVLVIAGPGTGKTQILSLRVANILRKTDVDPSNILCLTFTNKAALNMRERILTLTNNEAKGVVVRTFHSFAAEIMNTHPDAFWNGARLSTAPDAVQLEVVQTILSKLPLSSPLALKFAGNFTAGRDVLKALKNTKEAGLTPEQLRALVSANLHYINLVEPMLVDILEQPLRAKLLPGIVAQVENLPDQGVSVALEPLQDLGTVIKTSLRSAIEKDEGTNKTKAVGKWKQRWLQNVNSQKGMHAERDRNTWWLELATVYELYRDELHARGYYDYSDMIVEVIKQLQSNKSLVADIQEHYQYVLIDEFQDTNAAQLTLAHLVADHPSANHRPNIMAVGDDDQSIYKFNGAELNNMLSFTKSYPSVKVIVLASNYRSTQTVLDSADSVIQAANDRLLSRMPGLTKSLTAQINHGQKGNIEHAIYPTEEYELSAVAAKIKRQYEQGERSIAVLARDHASLRQLASMLHEQGVPVSYEQQNNIFDQPLVITVYTICSAVSAISGGDKASANSYIAQLILSPAWNIPPQEIWQLAVEARKLNDWLSALHNSSNTTLRSIANWLQWLAQQSALQPLAMSLEDIIGLRASKYLTSPLRSYYLNQDSINTEYIQGLAALRLLLATAKDFSRQREASLGDFVAFMNIAKDTDQIIADESVFTTGEHAVELLTVHKAKGLEFNIVYIINAIDSNWRPSSSGRKPPANLPLQPAGDTDDDYARLMYVAVTRARHTVIINSYEQDINGKEVMSTPLITELFPTSKHVDKTPHVAQQVLERHLQWPHLDIEQEKILLKDKLENYQLSASAFLDFLDIVKGGPQYFFEKHLLQLPEPTSASAAFGSAIHAALECAQNETNKGTFTAQKVVDHFKKYLHTQQLLDHDEARYSKHGELLLAQLLASDTFWLGKNGLAEQSINDVKVGNATLRGVIDRIDQNKERLLIIDYKTGKPLSTFTTRDQTKAIKAWRHRTQLIFYTLLVQHSARFNKTPVRGQMWYLEASQPKELIREYIATNDDLERIERLINIVYTKICNLELPNIDAYSSDIVGIQTFENNLLSGKI